MSGTPKWPADHHDKHAAAARLGWERRRGHLHRPTKRNEARKPVELPQVHYRNGYAIDMTRNLSGYDVRRLVDVRGKEGARKLLAKQSRENLNSAARDLRVKPGRSKSATVSRILDAV